MPVAAPRNYQSTAIPNAAAVSAPVNIGAYAWLGVVLSTTFLGSKLSFDVSADGNNYYALFSDLIAPGAASPAEWELNSNPAAAAQATVSKAAVAGVQHVAVGISGSLVVTTTLAAGATVALNLRDGATGAGAVLWTQEIGLPNGAVAGQSIPVDFTGLNVGGTVGNAMTLEFAGGIASIQQSVTLIGYDLASTEVTVIVPPAGANPQCLSLAAIQPALAPWQYLIIRSGTHAAPVNQTSAQTIGLAMKG
jgi:hypothetical protein